MTVSPGVGEVHVWAAYLEEMEFDAGLLSALSGDERDRAARFHFERDRRRYERRRCLLRLLLGRFLGMEAAAVRFRYGPQGKPKLGESGALQFNLSHSDGHALFAFARTEVGVDLQRIRMGMDVDSMARAVFAPGEKRSLEALPADQRVVAFFRYWTRKEAYIKARGLGLSLPLDSFEVSLEPEQGDSFEINAFPGFASCVAAIEPCRPPIVRDIRIATKLAGSSHFAAE